MEEQLTNPSAEDNLADVLDVASDAGHLLLENGAEIARIEETMERISSHYGVSEKHFFVLSNGIFTTGTTHENRKLKNNYASVEFIPLKGTQMEKIVEVNTLSRQIEAGKYSLAEAKERLSQIRNMPSKPFWEQLLGSAFGSAGFCAIFGGNLLDCAASFVVGLLLWAFVLLVSAPHLTKMLGNILSGAFASLLSVLFWKLGFGDNLGNMIVGALIPLIPGVPFTNGIRDVANEDYIAGFTRLLDAMLVFFAIAIGACSVFFVSSHFAGSSIILHGASTDPTTGMVAVQLLAAFVGTMGFSVLFGTPRKQYLFCGIVGAIAWVVYLVLWKYTGMTIFEATIVSAILTSFLARETAILRKCPNTVFLICGLFPLIPGGGIFWTTYYLVTRQFHLALSTGMTALSVTVAIVLGIVIVMGIPRKFRFFGKLRRRD